MTLRPLLRASAALSPLVLAATLAFAGPAPLLAREPVAAPAPAPAATNPQSDASRAWNFAASDVTVDPNIVFGVLPNGMKYALLKNSTPKDSVSLRLRFDVGSFAEADDQRGLAHFLEHMAFNGSTNVPEGEMIKLLERKGLAFGADTNASTGFDATVYQLDLPNASDDLVDTGLMLMRETASELKIDPAAVDRERGIILADTKFEFGTDADGRLYIMDEMLTPDSSRYWPADEYEVGTSPPSYDKQFVRDYLETLDWGKTAPGPSIPAEVIERTRAKYAEALQRLAGISVD